MDGQLIDTFSPQEDEFALLALGVPSVYRGFFDPRRIRELSCLLDPDYWIDEQVKGWVDIWLEFLGGIAENNSGRLILKSPGHTFRINALVKTFPRATYVWLVRDPIDTFYSNRKMWLAMFERYSFWNWDVSLLDDFLRLAFGFAAECLSRATRLLPRERLVVIPFDRLTGATFESLEYMNRRLLFGAWDEVRQPLIRVLSVKSGHRAETYQRSRLPDVVARAAEVLETTQRAALNSHGL
jgi:hypothetical protein